MHEAAAAAEDAGRLDRRPQVAPDDMLSREVIAAPYWAYSTWSGGGRSGWSRFGLRGERR